MQNTASRLAKVKNYCPDCVSVEIESRYDKSRHSAFQFSVDLMKKFGSPTQSLPTRRWPFAHDNIFLSICFAQQKEEVFGGTLAFGLRKGKLQFHLNGAEMRIKDRYGKELPASEASEVKTEILSENQAGGKISVKDVWASEASISSKNSEKKAFTEKQSIHRIKAVGDKHSPAWFFEEPDDQRMLDGMIKELQIGSAILYDYDWHLSFEFTFEVSDIYINGCGGLWMKDISKNKLAIIERKLAKTLLLKRMVSPISEGHLSPQA